MGKKAKPISDAWAEVGDKLQARRKAARDHKGQRISQPEFYVLVQAAERAKVKNRDHWKYADVTPDWAKQRVIGIENGAVSLTPYDFELFALAIGSPRSANDDLIKLVAPDTSTRQGQGFRRIAADSIIPANREPTQVELDKLCQKGGSRLIVVEGRTGAGKSFFLSHWFALRGIRIFGHNAMMLDASLISASEILSRIAEHLDIADSGQSPPFIAEAMSSIPNYLLIVDGLRASALLGRGKPDAVSLTALREGLFELLRQAPNLTVILCVENNSHLIEQRFLDSVGPYVPFDHFVMPTLSANDGAAFLASLLSVPLPMEQLRQISDHLQGMPLALTVVAAELGRLSESERERYAAYRSAGPDDLESEDGYEQFKKLILGYLALLEADRGTDAKGALHAPQASIHALLRLLALMPGPTTISHLRGLLDARKIRRLEAMTPDDHRLAQVPFIIRLDGKLDVHALVRRIFRGELDSFVNNNTFDAYTSRAELEWIHWRLALMNWAIIKEFGASGDTDGLGTSVIEAFVFHIMQLIRLTQPDRQRKRSSGGLKDNTVALFEEDIHKVTNVALWDIAYWGVVAPYLLERKYVSTRIHGQYDVKARVLEQLVRATDRGITIAPLQLAELHKEIAVCLMHGGHIISARREAELAMSALRGLYTKEGKSDDVWRAIIEIEGVIATVEARQGRVATEIQKRLAYFAQEAEERVRNLAAAQEGVRVQPGPAGALRVFARLADLDLQMGRTESAIEGFARADEIQFLIRRGRRLDGEAARKYVVALIRSREVDPERLEIAHKLVDDNIASYRGALTEAKSSSDLIPFLLQQASLLRIEGRLGDARKALRALQDQEYVRQAAYTFITGVELELEDLRLRIMEAYANGVTPCEVEGLAETAKALSLRLGQAHHEQASTEAELLYLEALSPEDRLGRLTTLSEKMRTSGWTLRMADVQELRRGASAVKKFGL